MKRKTVVYIKEAHKQSERKACKLISFHRGVCRYKSKRDEDVELRQMIKELAQERHRFDYRRLLVLLRKKGKSCNHKKFYRLYKEEGLSVKARKG